ncbi:MAG TPA: beta-N-acetylglucosaminidase domain-containing protein [Terriglobia bacterium]|nr:beta-N-acetylglucosaminidase domain-containing protein [Terriglobia bacterium]
MRNLRLKITFLIVLGALGPANLFALGGWTVVSAKKLDPRVMQQVSDLARQNHANIRMISVAPKSTAKATRGNLIIEFKEAESLDKFVETLKDFPGGPAKDLSPELAAEGYRIIIISDEPAGPNHIEILAYSAIGFHYALLRIPVILHTPALKMGAAMAPAPQRFAFVKVGNHFKIAIEDLPSFPDRGIVEGFYGKPWSHKDRLAMLKFEGQHAMNVYYYAPKDDSYHRALWRKPYPPARMKQLKELVSTAHANFVDFCFAISPGLSMVYSNEADFTHLTTKLDAVGKMGVSCFALFLDDVPQDLQNPQDKIRFKTLAEAHVYIINKLYDYLKSQSRGNRLVVTPTTYTNNQGALDYVREVGAGANPDVPLIWTGIQVVSPTITVAQAQEWGALLHRKPYIWDNFPVNDGIRWRVNLGPLRGRDPNLSSAVSGFVSNPMIQPQASRIPLQTVAEYLWNATAYDPDAAEKRALTDQFGKDAARDLAPFLTTYSDYWWDDNIFRPLFTEERKTIDIPEIRQRNDLLESAARKLRKKPRYQILMSELLPLPPKIKSRLVEVLDDPAFRLLPDQRIVWRDDYDVLYAPRVTDPISLDGDFSKWRGGPLYVLDQKGQIVAGSKFWLGPDQFSARFALAWDDHYFYIGVDVTDPNLYQPFTGRDITQGDAISLLLETAFRKNFTATSPNGDEYSLTFSPGDFAAVKPDVYSADDYLPPRPVPRNYNQEIRTAWKKTASGFSGDIAIPVAWFQGGQFHGDYEIGITLGAQKTIPRVPLAVTPAEESPQTVFHSKTDRVFPARLRNPSTYQRLVLIDSRKQNP